jgi:hypothetical protein
VKVADVELDVRALNPGQRVKGVGIAPGEPPAQLVGIQGVSAAGVLSQEGHRSELRRCHRLGAERTSVVPVMRASGGRQTMTYTRTAAHGEATSTHANPLGRRRVSAGEPLRTDTPKRRIDVGLASLGLPGESRTLTRDCQVRF